MKNSRNSNSFSHSPSLPSTRSSFYGLPSLFSPVRLFHVTYSKINKLWYIKTGDGPTHSVHLSKEKALKEANDLASYDKNGQVVLHHENGILEIIFKTRAF